MKKAIIATFILVIAGLLFMLPYGLYCYGRENMDTMSVDSFEVGKKVTKLIPVTAGSYASENHTQYNMKEVTDWVYYYLPVYDQPSDMVKIMTLAVRESLSDKLEVQFEEYMRDESTTPIKVNGTLEYLNDSELWDLYIEDLSELDIDPDDLGEYTVSYILRVDDTPYKRYISFGIGILLLLYGCMIQIRALRGVYAKQFLQDIRDAGYDPDEMEEELSKVFDHDSKLYFGSHFTYIKMDSIKPRALFNEKILWAYGKERATDTFRVLDILSLIAMYIFLPFIIFRTHAAPGRNHLFIHVEGFKKPFVVRLAMDGYTTCRILEQFEKRMPWVMISYAGNAKNVYARSIEEFKELKYNEVMEQIRNS